MKYKIKTNILAYEKEFIKLHTKHADRHACTRTSTPRVETPMLS